jgi:hypothetical protein
VQSGLCDISIAADDTAPIVLPVQTRPLKRPFAEVEEDAGNEPNSDELYGWVEEDEEVAAEGLLIDEAPVADAGDDAGSQPTGRSNKMARPSTL